MAELEAQDRFIDAFGRQTPNSILTWHYTARAYSEPSEIWGARIIKTTRGLTHLHIPAENQVLCALL